MVLYSKRGEKYAHRLFKRKLLISSYYRNSVKRGIQQRKNYNIVIILKEDLCIVQKKLPMI